MMILSAVGNGGRREYTTHNCSAIRRKIPMQNDWFKKELLLIYTLKYQMLSNNSNYSIRKTMC